MSYYSRTALRELKKRYLNILKKCFLLNLMAFSFVLAVQAETITERLVNKEGLTYTSDVNFLGITYEKSGGAISNSGAGLLLKENVKASFLNNSSGSYGGAIYSNWSISSKMGSILIFDGNTAQYGGGIASVNWTGGEFKGDTYFKNNSASVSSGGALWGYGSTVTFWGTVGFVGNSVNATGANDYATAGGLSVGGIGTFNGDAYFINNSATNISGLGARGGALSVGGGDSYPTTFNGNFIFTGNTVSSLVNSVAYGADIFNNAGIVNFAHGEGKVGILDGGIYQQGNGKINKTGSGILFLGDKMENGKQSQSSSKTVFNQSGGLTIAHTDKLNFAKTNNITGGILKTHGGNIGHKVIVGKAMDADGNVTSVGSAIHYTNLEEMTINKTIIGGLQYASSHLGATIGFGSYTKAEKDSEIALASSQKVLKLDEDNNVTYDNYDAAKNLLVTDTLKEGKISKFKVTGALDNEEGNILAFINGIVEIDESIGKTGATYELNQSVLESTIVQNKVLSKNMILGEAQEYSFTELEVAKGTTLDVKNKKINSETLTMNENSVLNIDLNNLSDHGKMSIGEVKGAEKGILSLMLTKGLSQEIGIYRVFDKDNELDLIENKLFNIKDLENGAYEVSKKTSENLMKDFDMTISQSKVTVALIDSEGSLIEFSKMQSEMLEVLQSTDKSQVQKAKKALKAVGKSEQSSAQALVSNHVGAVGKIVGGEMKGGSMKGHAGGEEAPRAKVYIKGLYDKTKSTMGDGFKARSQGAVLGVQSEVTDSLTLGVGYATSKTTAKEDLRRTEVDTNTGFISAHYQPNTWWLSGLATYSRGQYDEEKQVLSSVGTANYDVDSWGVQVMTGYDVKLQNAIITPEVGLRYLSVKQEGYTDTLGTTVEATSSDYLTAIAGIKTAWDLGKIRPTVGINVGYDVISDDVSALNTLANGASYTVNSEALDRLSVGISTGVEAKLNDRITLKLEYNGSFRKEYTDHSGMLKLEMRF